MILLFRSLVVTLLVSQSLPFYCQNKIAIIGGGMAGISGAHFISEMDPKAEIILFEKEAKLGGNAQTVQVKNKNGEWVNVDAGPQYFVEGPWDDYIKFLTKTLGKNPYKTESVSGTFLIQKEHQKKPVFVSPLGIKIRGEKLSELLKFKRFNKEAWKIYKNPKKWTGINTESWVKRLNFDDTYKNEIIYPFLAASLGTSVSKIKKTSAVDIVKVFAFRKPKANNKFKVMTDGMGNLLQQVGEKMNPDQITIRCSTPVTKVIRSKDKWLVTYSNNGKEQTELVDFVVFATHPDQTAKILTSEPGLEKVIESLKHLTYFEIKVALHSDSSFSNPEKPSFLNVMTDNSNEVISSTMNLSMISNRLDGIYKSWVGSEAIDQLKKSGKLLHVTSFWHPLITVDFILYLRTLQEHVSKIPTLYLSGGWSEGLETQNSAVISGKHAAEKYQAFLSTKK